MHRFKTLPTTAATLAAAVTAGTLLGAAVLAVAYMAVRTAGLA